MQDVSEHQFEFTLSDLPRAEFVKLSDAPNLALYGGVLSIRYEGSIPSSAIEDGMLSIAEGTWILDMEHGRVLGPRCVNVARPGAILFDIEDSSEPDPTRSAELEQKDLVRLERHRKWLAEQPADRHADLALAPSPRRHDPAAIPPLWKAEIARRQIDRSPSLSGRTAVLRWSHGVKPCVRGFSPRSIPSVPRPACAAG